VTQVVFRVDGVDQPPARRLWRDSDGDGTPDAQADAEVGDSH
jgi:hypothetical protein